jgi:hypothetical protein
LIPPNRPASIRGSARVEIVVPIRMLVVIAGSVALAAPVMAVRRLLLSIVLAADLSLGLDLLVAALVRRGWPRARAAVCVFASLFAVIAVIVAVTIDPLWNEIRAFADHLPDYWNQLASNPTLKPLLSRVSERSIALNLSTLKSGPGSVDLRGRGDAARQRHDLGRRRRGGGPLSLRIRPAVPGRTGGHRRPARSRP